MQDRAITPAGETPPDGPVDRALVGAVAAAWPSARWSHTNLVVACSGGADSVALLRVLADLKKAAGGRGELVVAHLDHGVRAEASAEDAAWVGRLAESLGLKACLERAEAPADGASEETLRETRRDYYRRVAQSHGARYVATGHTADDQAETVLFRALRGSGIRGLAGVRPTAPLTPDCTLVRPLLGVSRSQVEAYLSEIGQPHREDATNAQTDYTRNWLRHEVLPRIAERMPQASERLARLADHAAEVSEALEFAADELLEASLLPNAPTGGWRLNRRTLAGRPAALVAEALRLAWRRSRWPEGAMTATAWQRLRALATATESQPAEEFPGGVRAEVEGESFVLVPPTGG